MYLPVSIFLILCSCVTVIGKYTGPTNQAALNIIKECEGFHPNTYVNTAGKCAIGYGHVCNSCSAPNLGKYEIPLCPDSAEAILKADLKSRGGPEACVNNAISYRHLRQNEFSALVSYAHSVGCDAFRLSYVRNKVNRGQLKEAGEAFEKNMDTSGGSRKYGVLVRRRRAEKTLFSRDAELQKRKEIESDPNYQKRQEEIEYMRKLNLVFKAFNDYWRDRSNGNSTSK